MSLCSLIEDKYTSFFILFLNNTLWTNFGSRIKLQKLVYFQPSSLQEQLYGFSSKMETVIMSNNFLHAIQIPQNLIVFQVKIKITEVTPIHTTNIWANFSFKHKFKIDLP